MSRERVDVVVVGAGVIGLAAARSLALRDLQVLVLEAAPDIGGGISARNSEVVHAGIYYSPGSLKARLCVEGRQALYDYCGRRGIPFDRCGKLIVAAAGSESKRLGDIRDTAVGNGVNDLEWLAPEEVRDMEPEVLCAAALLSPSTGIVDARALMLSLAGDVENAGGHIVTGTTVEALEPAAGGFAVTTDAGGDLELLADRVVVAAGLKSQYLALRMPTFPRERIPPSFLCKGNYFVLNGARPFSRLVYPLPDRHGLGIHATLDLSGSVRFGPDTEWVDREDYRVDPSRAGRFYSAIRRYYPGLRDDSLTPGYAGIRPKTSGPGGNGQDFDVLGPQAHGLAGLVAMFGIESPGLTSSLAIGEYAADLLGA